MAKLANSAVQLCQRLQELYPQKFQFPNIKSEQTSPFRRWTTGSGAGSSYRQHDHRGIYSKQMSEGTAPLPPTTNGGCGGVARWSLGLEQLLADAAGASAFAHFLAKEFAAENIRFWWSCEQYRSCSEEDKRTNLAAEIWQTHLAEGASEPVNVDAAARRAAALRLHQTPPPQDLFMQAQKQIFNVMKFDSYPRFLRSGVHAECARADLRGLPPPYAPHSPHSPQSDDSNAKLKKSASNASDRRRSGASLLPWKSRAASRDRTNSTASTASTADDNDAVKSSQVANGQWVLSGNAALCRVMLPDGATSVVGVAPDISVRRLVDRLLQRRNLLCTTYDVIIKDGNQGSGVVVDATLPSTALGGRCLCVEQRCVVRVLVGGRAVAVRCRPARRLRHVLRPVLQRYCPPLQQRHAVLLGGTPVHPDTLVQELDGARIQVVEVSGAPPAPLTPLPADPRDDDADADSLSDVALRVHDDTNEDAQSTSRGSVSSVSSVSGMSGVSGEAAQSARVRAALRPGHPLHHHPPDFLDNLRETQRQRLQPRTPPPLPPKPAQRSAPTVV